MLLLPPCPQTRPPWLLRGLSSLPLGGGEGGARRPPTRPVPQLRSLTPLPQLRSLTPLSQLRLLLLLLPLLPRPRLLTRW